MASETDIENADQILRNDRKGPLAFSIGATVQRILSGRREATAFVKGQALGMPGTEEGQWIYDTSKKVGDS
jgi:hypothetical protein